MQLRAIAALGFLVFFAILGSSTTPSDAGAGKTCRAACSRISSCKLVTYDLCMDMCADQGAEDTAEGRRTNMVQARSSCRTLANQMASDKWLCTAQGESAYGYDLDGNLGDVQGTNSVYLHGVGKTRAIAAYNAVSDCEAMMSVDLNRTQAMNMDPDPRGQWGSAVSAACRITQCIAPAKARRQR